MLVSKLRRLQQFIEKKRIIEARAIYGVLAVYATMLTAYLIYQALPMVLNALPSSVKAMISWGMMNLLGTFGLLGALAAIIVAAALFTYAMNRGKPED